MRGCAEACDFCAIPEIAGKRERSQEIDVIIRSLKLAKAAGVRRIMFTSDNFNQWSKAKNLMREMARERLRLPFMIQCTTLLHRDEEFFELARAAECSQVFFGIESIDKRILREETQAPERSVQVRQTGAPVPQVRDLGAVQQHHRLRAPDA